MYKKIGTKLLFSTKVPSAIPTMYDNKYKVLLLKQTYLHIILVLTPQTKKVPNLVGFRILIFLIQLNKSNSILFRYYISIFQKFYN